MASPIGLKNRYRLSEIDVVPDNYFPMDEILRTKSVHMSELDARIMRGNALHNMVNKMKADGREDFLHYWKEKINSPVAEKMTADIFPFLKIMKLAPICHLIEAFARERKITGQKQQYKEVYVSFGIRKDLFSMYFKEGNIQNVLDDRLIKAKRKRAFIKCGENTNENRISVSACPQLIRWRDWCKLKGKSQSIAALEAIVQQMEMEPVDGLPSIESYRDMSQATAEQVRANGGIIRNVKISEKVKKQMYAIVYNYNADPETIEPIDLNGYIEQAVAMLNAQMPIKYSAPDIYKERNSGERVV